MLSGWLWADTDGLDLVYAVEELSSRANANPET